MRFYATRRGNATNVDRAPAVRSLSRLIIALALASSCQRAPRLTSTESVPAGGVAATEPEPTLPTITMPLEPAVKILRVNDSGLPCDVDDVLAAKCRRCHTTPMRHSAPFPLLTWEDTRPMRGDRPRWKVMGSAVQTEYMPYNIEANPPVQRLSDAEKQVILAWVEAGAPRGTCGSSPAASASAGHASKKKSH